MFDTVMLKGLENPYLHFYTAENFAENKEAIDGLSPEEQRAFATRLIQNCPKEELRAFNRVIESTKEAWPDEVNGFYAMLSHVYYIRNTLLGVLDERNKQPFLSYTGVEFTSKTQDIYNEFQGLFSVFADGHENDIATRLALTTPGHLRSSLNKNLQFLCQGLPGSKTSVAAESQAAFELIMKIEKELITENPCQFFLSKDNNIELCIQFPALLERAIAGQEGILAQRIAEAGPAARSSFEKAVDRTSDNPKTHNNPLKTVHELYLQLRAKSYDEKSSSSNPNRGSRTSANAAAMFNPLRNSRFTGKDGQAMQPADPGGYQRFGEEVSLEPRKSKQDYQTIRVVGEDENEDENEDEKSCCGCTIL